MRKKKQADLGQIALGKAVEGSLLGNGSLQGHLHHAQQVWKGILQQRPFVSGQNLAAL